jgi:lipid II:glycine glycyltransferase (peptidoglycan interpeptide bridge formation enzyme)
MAQILFKTHGPICIAYLPNGPATGGDHAAAFRDMRREVEPVCRRMRAVSLIVEPGRLPLEPAVLRSHGLEERARPFQPRKTYSVFVRDDATMLAAMHHKTRYHVRLAERQGVVTTWHPPTAEALSIFSELYDDTVQRNGITPLPHSYFAHLRDAFRDDLEIVIGARDGNPLAAAMVVRFGREAHYLFAGSSTAHRGQGAGALVVYRTLQRAREQGCDLLDLGSIESEGLRTFKTGFGGIENVFMPSMELRFQPAIAWLMWQAVSAKTALNREVKTRRMATLLNLIKG